MRSVAPDGRAAATRGAWLETASPQRGPDAARTPDHRVSSLSLVLVVGVAALLVGLAVAMETASYDIWGGLLVGMILLLFTTPLATRASRRWNDPSLGRLILLAAALKLAVGSAARYYVVYTVYRGASDSERYYNAGAQLAPFYRRGDFSAASTTNASDATHFVEKIVGVIISVIGESRLGVFVVFAWMSFLGLYLFYTAFRLAFPDGDHRRYALLLFFWPSMIFWPSCAGKDAWMMWMVGMSVLGVANLFVGRWRGLIWLAVGSAGCVAVRPHISLIIVAGAFVGLLLRRNRGAYSRMLARPLGTIVLLVGMILVGTVMFQQTESFFDLESLNLDSAQGVLASTSELTSEGGTAYAVVNPNSPIGYVRASVTVLFRPFPTEVGGNALFTGLEGVLLAGLVVASLKRIVRVPRMSLQNAYVAFSATYTFAFIYAFSSIGNFGILARERTQLFPVFFVLLAIPPRKRADDVAKGSIDVVAADAAIDQTALVTST